MNNKKVIIFHGTEGSPDGNWFGWLEKTLTNKGYNVWLPKLPNAKQPSLNEWAEFVLNKSPFELDEDTVLIGHSSGAILNLIIAQRLKSKINKLISVGVFKDNSLGWDANNRLFDVNFDFDKIKANCTNILFIHSDDDPYCPMSHAKYFAKNLEAQLEVIPGQGHFNLEKSPDFVEFPAILNFID